MLLAEMVRKPISEANLVTDTGSYSSSGNHDWQDRVSKNITLTEGCYIHVKWTTTIESSTSTYAGQSRVLVDGVPVAASGASWSYGSQYNVTREFYLYLAAGNHTLTWQSCMSSSTAKIVTVKDIYVWRARLEDCEREQASGTGVSLVNGAETTVINNYVITPAAPRPIPVGLTKQGRLVIRCFMGATSRRDSYPKNPGEANANLSWKLYINGTQVSWTVRYNDDTGIPTTNPTYGCGCYAYYDTVYTHGVNVTVKVACYNATGGDRSGGFCYLDVFMCPWLIPATAYEPVTIEAPQGSTLYLVLEPFSSNPTKTVKYGYVRWVTFGDTTDYYSTASGTGILTWSYTNELVYPNKVSLTITGDGGCISMIGCDVR
ncbi:MAG: hypothetical protein QXF26_05450 [Candidatus Bathyarchaeia archaeon]